ncbi:DNA gyrase inhibitor [Erwinia toletana]|uniref:DNA gyrase inhibitor n=1 Tax=Winslowiella toletana TaxID=92490 RepID=A0ABS4P496_9GAMM|nr:DNA gyrase inhibitor SbmC [Winslowiella toletana]MBP2167439.1 DNA gyrase inhibitor [Winslowiella toletana]
MNVQIMQLPQRTIAGYRLIGPWPQTAPAGFEKLSHWVKQHQIVGGDWLAVYYDNPEVVPEEALRIDTAISVPDDFVLPSHSDEVEIRHLAAGTYAVAQVRVEDGDFAKPWLAMFAWLAGSDYHKADAPCFDRYLNDGSLSGIWEFEICVPVIKS